MLYQTTLLLTEIACLIIPDLNLLEAHDQAMARRLAKLATKIGATVDGSEIRLTS